MKTGIRTLSLYFVFVGLPLLGVLGALWLGADLSAPASVGGAWVLEIPQQTALDCPPFADWRSEMQMVISQSGPELLIVLDDAARTPMTGNLSELSITAETSESTNPELLLAAEIDRQTDPHHLSGNLQANGCPSSLDFTGALKTQTITAQEH